VKKNAWLEENDVCAIPLTSISWLLGVEVSMIFLRFPVSILHFVWKVS
jgi:hypothetical protein